MISGVRTRRFLMIFLRILPRRAIYIIRYVVRRRSVGRSKMMMDIAMEYNAMKSFALGSILYRRASLASNLKAL